MRLKNTEFPWTPEQTTLRDSGDYGMKHITTLGELANVLKVRLHLGGKTVNMATFSYHEKAVAARFADMAYLFFADYRMKLTSMEDDAFNFNLASAQSDLANSDPALQCARGRFAAIIKKHKLILGGETVKRIDLTEANKILSARITDLTHRLDTLEKRLEHRDQTVALLVAQVKTCLDAMPHINRRLDAVESGLTCSNTAQATLERSIGSIGANSLHANQADHNAKIAALEAYNTELQMFLAAVKPAIEETDNRVRRIETQINIKG